jgi:tRNA modification GTPase
MYQNDTIIAAATPKGVGALAILRLSGNDSLEIFKSLIKESGKFESSAPFELKLYTLFSPVNGEVLDEVTAVKFSTPRSFTGENMVEITCHGGAIIVERVVEAFIMAGVRYAGRGEFSRRAFLNGKVDLKKAESINRIIHAESVMAHKSAVKHYLGDERKFFDTIKDELQQLLVAIETEIEFSETDDIGAEELFTGKISDLVSKMISQFKEEISKRERLKQIDKGVTVALAGRANAGKSSILNMVLGYNRAIINSRAGTTRDLITETRLIKDIKVQFVDTAGLNETSDEIEMEGIRRTEAVIKESEIVCWVIAADEPFPKEDFELLSKSNNLIVLLNKKDLASGDEALEFLNKNSIPVINLSALKNEGNNELLTIIEKEIEDKFSDMDYETVIGSDREEGVIRRLLVEAEEIDLDYPSEILAESIRSLLGYFDEIYGKSSPDDILNRVFNDFCIGK